MATKVLSYSSCKRFYRLRDALADYAYGVLDIEGNLYAGRGRKYGTSNLYHEEVLADTLDAVWETPAVLEDFIRKNPASFGPAELAVLRDWRSALNGFYTLFKHEGRLLFLRGGVLFEVSGLIDDIENILRKSDFPYIVETTLLPFEGRIVYHGFISHVPLKMGAGILNMLNSEIEEALRDVRIISRADEFAGIASEIRAEESEHAAEREKNEAALAEEGKRQMKGYHRGVLAGLSEQEREEAIQTQMNIEMSGSVRDAVSNILQARTTKGKVSRDLGKLISGEPKEMLRRWSLMLGIDVSSTAKKAELIQELLPVLRTSRFLPELTIRNGFALDQFDAYRKLYEDGGVLEIREDEIDTLGGLPVAQRLLCYSFYTKGTSKTGGKFTFVIPEDIMGVLDEIDWDDDRDYIKHYDAAADIADAVCDLRGIAKIDEVFDEFCRFYPAAMDRNEYKEAVMDAIEHNKIGCVWLEADDGSDYLLHYEVAGYYREAMIQSGESQQSKGYDCDYRYEDICLQGPVEPLAFILDERKGKAPRPLEMNMFSSNDVFDWKYARPTVRALRMYLDEHVPDSEDDYYYADAVIEELIDYMTLGAMSNHMVEDLLEIMEDHGYSPNEGHLNRIIQLLMNMHNSMPTWMNNGWAPDELLDKMYGRKSFYNEDGSRMKVGRNDPCPCGSGKKYKNCCGRR